MLFLVHMVVNLPRDLDPATRAETLRLEKEYSQELQRAGAWPHLWRVVGQYANYSVLDVDSNDELHAILSGLPLYEFLKITVTPLATHPSDLGLGLYSSGHGGPGG